MTGSAETLCVALDVAFPLILKKRRGFGGGVGARSHLMGGLADDGKRLDSLSRRWTLHPDRV